MFDLIKNLSILKKLISKRDLLIIIPLIASYLFTRLIRLDQFPIFSDEGIYIHWAKLAWHDASWRFVSLTDGRQPLQTWGTIPFLKLFPDNALLAGRLFSVTTGIVALIGIFTLLYYLFGKKTAFFGAFFYIFTPYFLFYDRIALIDSGVNATFIWILFFSLLLARTQRLDISLIFGLIGGAALLTKSSVRLFLGLSIFAPILFFKKNIKKSLDKIINYIFLFSITIVLSLFIYNVQRLSPFFHFVSEKNKTFVMTFSEFIKTPFAFFWGNIKLVPLYSAWEAGFILAILAFFGLIVLYKKDKRLFYYFFLWLIIPYIAVSFFSKVIFPRYLIFFASLYLILTSYFLINLKNKNILIAVFVLYFFSSIYFDYAILFDHKNIPFPPVDRGQYIEGNPAGWGMKEIVDFARQKSKEKRVIILAEGNFGLTGDVLDTFVKKNDNIFIKAYWPLEEKELLENQKEIGSNYVIAVFAQRNVYPVTWPLKLIKKIEKPNNKSSTYLFELIK